jgi:hypothetical protein
VSIENGITGITLSKVKGFDVSENDLISCIVGIRTDSTRRSNSLINQNLFYENDSAVCLFNSDHWRTDIHCNAFIQYNDYGIYSAGSDLKQQGDSATGAGNIFMSSSTNGNHQLLYDGNPFNYYCDPAHTFTLAYSSPSLSAVALTSENDADCTVEGRRPGKLDNESVGQSMSKAVEGLLNCNYSSKTDQLKINYRLPSNAKNAELKIINSAGTELASYNLGQRNFLNIPAAKYKKGVFYFTLSVDGNLIEKKEMILKN